MVVRTLNLELGTWNFCGGFAALAEVLAEELRDSRRGVVLVPDADARHLGPGVFIAETPHADVVAGVGAVRPGAFPELEAAVLRVRIARAEVDVIVVDGDEVFALPELHGNPLVVAVVILLRTPGGLAGVDPRIARLQLGENHGQRVVADAADGLQRLVDAFQFIRRRLLTVRYERGVRCGTVA